MEVEYDFSQGKRGAIEPTPPGKTLITIRLDDEVLAWFREKVHQAGGGNYQTLINDALRNYIQQHREPLEETLRRVLREELERVGERKDKDIASVQHKTALELIADLTH